MSNSCRTHCSVEIAILAIEHLLELEPVDTGYYVLCPILPRVMGSGSVCQRLRNKSMKKTPGCSLMEVKNYVQAFVAGDDSKPFAKHIFQMLDLRALHENVTSDMIEIIEAI